MTCTTHDPLAHLWTAARDWLAEIAAEFGPPAHMAQLASRKLRAALKRHLKAMEALVLKLLLIEASKLCGPPSSSPSSPDAAPRAALRQAQGAAGSERAARSTRQPEPQLRRPELVEGQAARAITFPLRIPTDPPPRAAPSTSGPRIRDLGRPILMTDVWRDNADRQRAARLQRFRDPMTAWRDAPAKAQRLARRFEALRGVLADPRPHVLRLLRKLAVLGKAAFGAACAIALHRKPRMRAYVRTQCAAMLEAGRATRAFRDSS